MADTVTQQQFIRRCQLIVSNRKLDGLDLSQFRIKFSVKRSNVMTPNVADIRVYNLDEKTALQIKKEFSRVTLQGGYESNYGVIFQGNIKQVILGRESATDTFVDLVCGDGDQAFNFAIVVTTLSKGSTQSDQITAAAAPMADKGVTTGHIGTLPVTKLPRGKVMFGNSHKYLRNVAETSDSAFSIQNEKITFIPKKAYLPGEAVVLTSKTGMIGTPQQTNEGVNIKCLINPNIRVGGRVKIDNKSVAQLKLNLSVAGSPANTAAPLGLDGMYFVLVIEHTGDTRGIDWYSNLLCLYVSPTSNPANSVYGGTGG